MIESVRATTQPYAQWLLSNKNAVIVVFGVLLFFLALQNLIGRWRVEKLQRDLSEARSTAKGGSRRVYAPGGASESEVERGGGLPPVRGGRTYARNLGNALQKVEGPAGRAPSGPPIYTPPAPGGWTPPPVGNPPTGPVPDVPYGQPAHPWAAPVPAAAGAPSWPYAPSPLSQPPPAPPPQPPGAPAPPYFPPMRPGAGQPTMPPAISPPAAPAPAYYQPTPVPYPQAQPVPMPPLQPTRMSEPVAAAPALPAMPPMQSPGPTPGPQVPETAAEAKPKRRRFGLHVLQSLEKALQEKAASLAEASARAVASATQPSAPAAPALPPVTPTPPPPPIGVPPQPVAAPPTPIAVALPEPIVSAVAPLSTVEEIEAPAAPAAPPARAPRGKRGAPPRVVIPEPQIEPEPEPEPLPLPEIAPEAAEVEPEVMQEAEAEPEAEPQAEPVTEPESHEVPEPAVVGGEFRENTRTALRNMLFGAESDEAEMSKHEPAAATDEESAAEAAPLLTEPEVEAPSAVESEPMLDFEPEPVAEAEAEPSQPEPALPAASRGERAGPGAGTLVIIEDDQKVAEYYATLFSGNGYRVEVATDGVSGVDLCARVQPNVIMLDVMMPRQNGILVLQTLRASDETRDTPVVVLSNFSEPTLIKRALQLGALEYVIKTQVEGAALLQAVPRWMKRQKAFAA